MEVGENFFKGADRIKDVYFSPVRIVSERVEELRKEGFSIINFGEGEPDFNTPKGIIDATIEALNNNMTHYSNNRGMIELRQEISIMAQRDHGIKYDPDSEIIVTSAGAETINDAILGTLNPGDEAIVFTPAFFNYENLILMAGATMVDIKLRSKNGFQIDPDELRRNITKKTKMIIINNPCNPTGVVYSKEVLEEVSKIACEFDLIVFSDEMYDRIVYEGVKFHSMASFDGMRERTIIGNGFSKFFSMTGWRVGYIMCDKRMSPNLLKVHHYCTTCTPTFIQAGLAKAMNTPEVLKDAKEMIDTFKRRKNAICAGLDKISGLSYTVPMGAFYAFVDVSKTGIDGDKFSKRLLEERHIATIPGSGLGGEEYKDFIRLSFVTDEENIVYGLDEIADFVLSLQYEMENVI